MTLNFAILARISADPPDKRKTSLETQISQCQNAVESLRGKVVKIYSGIEHGTPDYERKILSQLIEDAQAGKFNAVMVASTDRWSRDNQKSKEYLKIFQHNGTKFFVLGMEYNLHNPESFALLSMGVEISELYASQFAYKVMMNKILRARKNIPSASGKLPFGRTFNRQTLQWGVDKDKQKLVKLMGKKYLRGMNFVELSKEFHIPQVSIWNIFRQAGDTYTLHFESKRFNIKEEVVLKIPPLLDHEMIQQINEKRKSRLFWDKNNIKHQYLFSKFIFDKETGHALTGLTSDKQYYRNYHPSGKPYLIRADLIEDRVYKELIDMILHEKKIHQAVYGENNLEQQKENLLQEIEDKKSQLDLIQKKKNNFLSAIGNFSGSESDIRKFLDRVRGKIIDLEKDEERLTREIKALEDEIKIIPTKEELNNIREQLLVRQIEESWRRTPEAFDKLPFEKKRALLKVLFGGRDSSGRRFGIYVQPQGKRYEVTVYGRLVDEFKLHLTTNVLLKFK